MTAVDAARRRRSHSKVTGSAPTHEQLLPLIEAAATVADHGALRPWRIIEIRDEARATVGRALAEAAGEADDSKLARKPLRAELLLAVVVAVKPSHKVPAWEQEATASGVAHLLSLLLDEDGWGVMWRTGNLTRSEPVHRAHGLAANEQLLGWLYVGGRPTDARDGSKRRIEASEFLTAL